MKNYNSKHSAVIFPPIRWGGFCKKGISLRRNKDTWCWNILPGFCRTNDPPFLASIVVSRIAWSKSLSPHADYSIGNQPMVSTRLDRNGHGNVMHIYGHKFCVTLPISLIVWAHLNKTKNMRTTIRRRILFIRDFFKNIFYIKYAKANQEA